MLFERHFIYLVFLTRAIITFNCVKPLLIIYVVINRVNIVENRSNRSIWWSYDSCGKTFRAVYAELDYLQETSYSRGSALYILFIAVLFR